MRRLTGQHPGMSTAAITIAVIAILITLVIAINIERTSRKK
jgi:hypothetical protein